jgi:protein Mpv17
LQCVDKVRQALPPTFATGCLFWPAANLLNFMFVPTTGRVAYANAAGLLWNGWLSYENSTKGAVKAAPAATDVLQTRNVSSSTKKKES